MDIRIRVILVGKGLGVHMGVLVYWQCCFFIWGLSPKFVPFVKIHQDVYTLDIFVVCALDLLYFNKKFT